MNGHKSLYPIWLGVLGIALLAGAVAGVFIFMQGHVLFNANDVLIWTLPLGVYIFLALSSSGLTLLSALPLVFGIKKYEPFAKRLVFLAIATLCGGFVSIGLELGSIFHMIYIMLSPNLSSPIWWMGAIYSVELAVLVLKFWKIHTGDYHSGFSKLLGTASFVLALIAPLMIGSVFGLTESRATYFGPVMSIYCLLMAVLSGTALFILYSLVVGRVTADASSGEYASVVYDDFTLILTYSAGIVAAFTLLKIAIESSTTIPAFLVYHRFEHLFGSIGVFGTEVILGLFLPLVLLLIPSVRGSAGGRILASALIFVGSLARHMEILLAGQSHPVGPKAEQFPQYVQYVPSVWELLVLVFALAVMLLLYTLGERYLKLTETPTG
ncbi:MAG TPA: NrfD/PsrC family molybdoenzyme membrane anchor subunit [Desulfobacterales bacterium]|jgi:Ni/Fe-hydrogenase subunit HybB-like protein|nr:NrfD/PsrC family molybdoenzyme membrane anchor subunit [Desulfobacterales bacterium]